jgi:dTDP-4-amino-4,6-dideoxygalactose transaminase
MDSNNGKHVWGSADIRTCFSLTPKFDEIRDQIEDVFKSGILTNFGKYNCLLEKQLAEYLGVDFALTVPNASTAFQILLAELPKNSEVIVPSFTFPATVHAIVHAGLCPVFVDIDRATYNLSIEGTLDNINTNTSAILAVHVFGNPCDVDALEQIARENQIKLFFDAASAFGSKYRSRRIGGCGDAEVFSLSGPKILTAGEGGVITTRDKALAEKIRRQRNYGFSSDKTDCLYVGYNGKLSELSAILALSSLGKIDEQIALRRNLAKTYRNELATIDGIHFQTVLDECEFDYSFFAIELNPDRFGATARELKDRLKSAGIEAIRYFNPPVHKMIAYKKFNSLKLENTERLCENILCLPMHTNLNVDQVRRVCGAIKRTHEIAHKQPREGVGVFNDAYAGMAAYANP